MITQHIHQGILALALLGLSASAQAQSLKVPKKTNPASAEQSSPTPPAPGKFSTGLGESAGKEPHIDSIVAVVNSDVITRSELNRQVALIEQQMTRRGVSLPDRTTLFKQVLERMVLDKVQIQLATETGIRVDDAQIETAMNRVAEQNNATLPQFLETLKKEGVPANRFREEVRNELVLGRLREREVESKIQVSDAEIQHYLATKTAKGPIANTLEVNWLQLLVKVPNNATGTALTQAQTKVATIEKLLRNGASLGDTLKAHPDLALEGTGAMGWQHAEALPSLFTAFLTTGADNTVQTIRSANGFHILKLLERRNAHAALDNTPIPQTRARHILIRTSPDVNETEAKRRLSFALEQLRAGAASFETLAKRYSQDGSASKGGDLGWLYPGDTVPEFEREMNALQPNGVSPVFESRFGFHIIQVVERRQQAASEERQRQLARQAIRTSKSEESYQDWLRQLRDKTFIDIRL